MNKPWWKSYLHFSSTERNGIIAFSFLIMLMLFIRITMHHWIKPTAINTEEEQKLIAAWNKFKAEHATTEENHYASNNEPISGELFPFDPNTLDSIGFIRLGLRPKTTHLLLNWRRKGKTFYKKEDLKPLYTLSDEQYRKLEPYITITSVSHYESNYPSFSKQEPLPATIELNTSDSATLVRLYGIGPTLAHKIIEKRKALGGFVKHEQLMEVYRLSDTIYNMLRERVTINISSVNRLKLNTATLDELKAHPYIGEKVAKNIIMLREGLQRFNDIDQLRQVPLMNEEIYRKIAPYFTVD